MWCRFPEPCNVAVEVQTPGGISERQDETGTRCCGEANLGASPHPLLAYEARPWHDSLRVLWHKPGSLSVAAACRPDWVSWSGQALSNRSLRSVLACTALCETLLWPVVYYCSSLPRLWVPLLPLKLWMSHPSSAFTSTAQAVQPLILHSAPLHFSSKRKEDYKRIHKKSTRNTNNTRNYTRNTRVEIHKYQEVTRIYNQ